MTVHDTAHVIVRIGVWLLIGIPLACILWLGWDAVRIYRGDISGNSASYVVAETLYRAHPGVLLAVGIGIGLFLGVLCGHFGWVQKVVRP